MKSNVNYRPIPVAVGLDLGLRMCGVAFVMDRAGKWWRNEITLEEGR